MSTVARTLAAAALSVAALAGCAPPAVNLADYDYRLAHPLGAEARLAVLTLEIPARPEAGLGARDQTRLFQFGQDFVNKGEGIMEVLVAAPGGDAATGGVYADLLLRGLVSQGVRPDRIAARLVTGENVAAQGSAVLRYTQWAAVVPECGVWNKDVQVDFRSANSPNYGCATQRNIGLMVSNPRDLVEPRAMDTRPGLVGDRTITRYGLGQPTLTTPAPYEGR